jgi:phosphotransferase system IIB component
MKKIYIQIITLSVISVLAVGCTENIDNIQLDTTRPRLVVEGYISTDTTRQMVKLSKLGDALKQDPIQVVSNALVTISDGTKTFNLAEDATKKGTYFTAPDVYGVPGRTYTLNIRNVDINNDKTMEEYSAISLLKRLNPIDSVHLVYNNTNPRFINWSVNLYTMDPGQGRNFYLIKVIKNSILLTDSVFKYSIGDNSGFEGKYYNGFPVYNLREERKDERVSRGDTVKVELYGITEDYFSFIYSYITDYYPKVPIFSGPSANIPSNIKPTDDAVGIFTAYSVKRKSVIYK